MGAGTTLTATDIFVGTNGEFSANGATVVGNVHDEGGTVDLTMTIDGNFTIDSGVLQLHQGNEIDVVDNTGSGHSLSIGPNATIELIVSNTVMSINLNDYLKVLGSGTLSIASSLFTAPGGIEVFTPTGGQMVDLTFTGTDNMLLETQVAAQTAPVPEPPTLALFGFGLMGLGWMWRRRLASRGVRAAT